MPEGATKDATDRAILEWFATPAVVPSSNHSQKSGNSTVGKSSPAAVKHQPPRHVKIKAPLQKLPSIEGDDWEMDVHLNRPVRRSSEKSQDSDVWRATDWEDMGANYGGPCRRASVSSQDSLYQVLDFGGTRNDGKSVSARKRPSLHQLMMKDEDNAFHNMSLDLLCDLSLEKGKSEATLVSASASTQDKSSSTLNSAFVHDK